MYNDRRNKFSGLSSQGTDVLYIVPLFFVEEWRKFIRYVSFYEENYCFSFKIKFEVVILLPMCASRRPTKSSPVSNVGNTLLLCPHGGFMFTYDSLINGDAQQ